MREGCGERALIGLFVMNWIGLPHSTYHTLLYIYIYVCVCVCVCVTGGRGDNLMRRIGRHI